MIYKKMDQIAVKQLLPERMPDTHKGDYGRILLLCGSKGFTGAAALAAMGALRSGAGVVYLGVPESIYPIEAAKLLEPVVFPLPEKNGMLRVSRKIEELLPRMDSVLVGPGLGQSKETFSVVETVLRKCQCPVVLDADGINVLSGHKNILRDRKGVTVLTPHDGEFLRIAGSLGEDRCADAAAFAAETGCVVLLKGYRTVITDGESCYVNETGNPGMAVGGSGDVLAGIIVSLLGQGIDPLQAAACGAWVHGAAGDICAREIGQYGMLPRDMLNVLPRLLP